MKWTLKQIRDSKQGCLSFDLMIDVEAALKARESSVIHLDPVQVTGDLVARGQEYVLHCQLKTIITLPSTRTLEPVALPMELPIRERYVGVEDDVEADEYEETTIVLEHDYIDLEPAVVDVILLNLPMQVIGPDEEDQPLPTGNDWTVVTEEEYKEQIEKLKSETIDPRFANLKALLNEDHTND
ncbi:YceD family protein [Vaginisenegalia massiliensis]|uniref:YceD family protein n=1 Tax=Vaginisenegalia massiliensis TaxID=2058294 RepID=UPI000F5309A2|nr:YceD family protein [Vaginisenegalia massiliensis]